MRRNTPTGSFPLLNMPIAALRSFHTRRSSHAHLEQGCSRQSVTTNNAPWCSRKQLGPLPKLRHYVPRCGGKLAKLALALTKPKQTPLKPQAAMTMTSRRPLSMALTGRLSHLSAKSHHCPQKNHKIRRGAYDLGPSWSQQCKCYSRDKMLCNDVHIGAIGSKSESHHPGMFELV